MSSPGARDSGSGREEQDPEVVAVLEGRDSIALSPELVAEPVPPEHRDSLFARIRALPVPARVKLALTGNKEARQILADANLPNVHPAKTMDEAAAKVVELAKGGA